MHDEIMLWWDTHKAMKADIMYLVVHQWMCNASKPVITAHVNRYLNEHKDWLPCSPREFYENYFIEFWPEF